MLLFSRAEWMKCYGSAVQKGCKYNIEGERMAMMQIPKEEILKKVYGDADKSRSRFERLAQSFTDCYGEKRMEFFTAPGRTEIIGNHTDHNGGKVIAASIDMDTIGAAFPNDSDLIEIVSEGYEGKTVVDIAHVDDIPINQGTLSLVAGMVKAMQESGFRVSGFRAYVSTNVISAAGVSSSASFEMLICSIVNYFFNESRMSYVDYAKIGQYAENHYWSKASGLMDQMACAVGGAVQLDFSGDVEYKKVDFSFEQFGYRLVIVNTGKGHADLSRDYSDVPDEMRAVAGCLGAKTLSETSLEALMERLPEVVKAVDNDRAILRAVHFFEENRRVEELAEAIGRKDGGALLRLLDESGRSSWELLQNCYSIANYTEQKITLCLAVTELFLNKKKTGCCRVHGGGFAGVIACIVPEQDAEEYVRYMARLAGEDSVYPMKIREVGAVHLEK